MKIIDTLWGTIQLTLQLYISLNWLYILLKKDSVYFKDGKKFFPLLLSFVGIVTIIWFVFPLGVKIINRILAVILIFVCFVLLIFWIRKKFKQFF